MKLVNKSITNRIFDWIATNKKIGDYTNMFEISKELDVSRSKASSSLFNLEKRGALELVGRIKSEDSERATHQYEVVDFPHLKFNKEPEFNVRIYKSRSRNPRKTPVVNDDPHTIKNYDIIIKSLSEANVIIEMFDMVVNNENFSISDLKAILKMSQDVRERIKRLSR